MARDAGEIEALIHELVGEGGNPLEPTADQLRALLEMDPQGPFQFVNLLAFHERARYPGAHPLAQSDVSGAVAYASYGLVAVRHVAARGGRLTHLNEVVAPLIGTSPDWHQIAIMQYPTIDAFVDMIRDPDYRAALVHRDAGLARTELHVTRPLLLGVDA